MGLLFVSESIAGAIMSTLFARRVTRKLRIFERDSCIL